jgi:hypothetical protein
MRYRLAVFRSHPVSGLLANKRLYFQRRPELGDILLHL